MQKTRIDVVVISYAGGEMLDNCLAALGRYRNTVVDLNIIVQQSAQSTPRNVNAGFGRVTSDWWVLFNDDWEPTQDHWLDVLYRFAVLNDEPESRLGAVCPRIIFQDGRINHAGYLISEHGEILNVGMGLDSNDTKFTTDFIDYVHPVLNNSTVFRELGGYDARTFVGSQFADVDYAYRCGSSYRVLYVDEVVLVHNHRCDESTKGPRNHGRMVNSDRFRRKHGFPVMNNGVIRRPRKMKK